MAQAGQPQKLEEDLDQAQQEEGEEDEPAPQQADENAVERDGAHPQQVSGPSALRTGTRICKEMEDIWYAAADCDVPAPGCVHQRDKCLVDSRRRIRGWIGRPLLVKCSNTLLQNYRF